MIWFDERREYGFISTEEDERLAVHGADFVGGAGPKGRCAGLEVTFVVTGSAGNRKAEEVVFVTEDAPRRARRRHGSMRAGT
jgi:cold shock CspA family protein